MWDARIQELRALDHECAFGFRRTSRFTDTRDLAVGDQHGLVRHDPELFRIDHGDVAIDHGPTDGALRHGIEHTGGYDLLRHPMHRGALLGRRGIIVIGRDQRDDPKRGG